MFPLTDHEHQTLSDAYWRFCSAKTLSIIALTRCQLVAGPRKAQKQSEFVPHGVRNDVLVRILLVESMINAHRD